jgi:hypothetical protein
MASNHQTVARTIREFVDANLTPEANARKFAITARGYRDEVIRAGQASERYDTFVDGREGAREETTRPGGAVEYRFNSWDKIIRESMLQLAMASPMDDGDFVRAWTLAVNGKPWTGDYEDIPLDADVMIVNPLPYARKVEVGAMKLSVPAHPIERARQRLLRKYQNTYFGKTFVFLPASFATLGYETPYILQGHAHRTPVQQSRRSSAFRQGRAFLMPRRDTQKGQQVTYPALTISLSR